MRLFVLAACTVLLAACNNPDAVTETDAGEIKGADLTCSITSSGAVYNGPCEVTSDAESVGLNLPPETPEFEYLVSIGMFEYEPGQWEVRGLTTDGINSRWGTATRSEDGLDCWEASDFRICVEGRE